MKPALHLVRPLAEQLTQAIADYDRCKLERYGHKATVARSADEALAFLASCGAPFVGRVSA